MADLDVSLVGLALVSATLAVFHKWMARTFYPSQKAFGYKGSERLLELTFIFGGTAMALVAVVILLVDTIP